MTDYLEKEYQENPLIDFDRRVFNKEGVSFEEDLSDIENNAVKRIVTGPFAAADRISFKKSPGKYCGIFNLFFRPQWLSAEESINEVIKFFPGIYGRISRGFYQMYAADGTDGGICKKPCRNVWCFSCRNQNQNIK